MSENITFGGMLASATMAMLGEIFPALRLLTIEWDQKNIVLRGYIDGEVKEEDWNSVSVIFANIITDFVDTHDGRFEVIRLDYPKPLHPTAIGQAIYRRREEY